MSSLNLTASNQTASGSGYYENLALAARTFAAALLAGKPVVATAAPADARVVEKLSNMQRIKAVLEMNRLASRYDSVMPNQAAELRYLASHC